MDFCLDETRHIKTSSQAPRTSDGHFTTLHFLLVKIIFRLINNENNSKVYPLILNLINLQYQNTQVFTATLRRSHQRSPSSCSLIHVKQHIILNTHLPKRHHHITSSQTNSSLSGKLLSLRYANMSAEPQSTSCRLDPQSTEGTYSTRRHTMSVWIIQFQRFSLNYAHSVDKRTISIISRSTWDS